MKHLLIIFLGLTFAFSTQAQDFKLDIEDILGDMDLGPGGKKDGSGPTIEIIIKKYRANKSIIMKQTGVSESEYSKIATQIIAKLDGKSAKALGKMESRLYGKASKDLRATMKLASQEVYNDAGSYGSGSSGSEASAYSASDVLSTGASGAAVGSAIGAGIGAAVGSAAGGVGAGPGAAVGAAIGGALGAAFGIGVGIGEEIAEELNEEEG